MDARTPGEQPPARDEDLEPTIAMPAVVVPPPRPRTEHGVVEPPYEAAPANPFAPSELPPHPIVRNAPPPGPGPAAPAGTVVAPAAVAPGPAAPIVPRFVFGNPVGYAFARFAAVVLDLVTVGMIATTFAYALIAVNPLTGLPTNSEGGFDATLGLGLCAGLVYVWLAEAIFGTTLWKLAFGLHVYAVRGRFVGLGRALLRNLLRPVDLLLIGGVLALLPGHRRLGDLVGGTVVARSPLRAFAPLVGWIGIILLAGLPWITVGPEHALATLAAFGEFVPRLIAHGWSYVYALATGYTAH
jgi:uncharacterized RDD family membrane protein YckC